ncbi:MAG TPA: UTP--glucose-1-phosphate uridylyltransferase [Chthoniobacterales bacterium]|jgi:UDP-N-acetylglucosamine pyrophosphorylase
MEQEIREKMQNGGLSESAISAFLAGYAQLKANATGLIPESAIAPVLDLPNADELQATERAASLFEKTVIIKLNGGLGTSMGLEKAKSLLPIRDGLTFLDLIARQILHLHQNGPVRFLLMNSFSTSADTLDFLKAYPALGNDLELMQNRVPKLAVETLAPIEWPENPALEWCPPGHGDIYPSLSGSGLLDRLLADGVKYLFVSNADNLGATLDPAILEYFAESDLSFLMEVTKRTNADRKGGHLAKNAATGKLLLRESAQCPEADVEEFQNIEKHRFFNTNNLWIRLDRLQETMHANGGVLPLPMIRNTKTVDPRDGASPKVYQLETAMGAAIGAFADAGAVEVSRTRFAPVKSTADLLALRSDAYEVTSDSRLVLASSRNGRPPFVDLDGKNYKFVDQLDVAIPHGAPSLVECEKLTVQGPVEFAPGVKIVGNVSIENTTAETQIITAGVLKDETVRS